MSSDKTEKSPISADVVRELAEILRDTELTEIEVERGDLRLRVAREIQAAPVMQAVAAPAPVAAAPAPAAPAEAPQGVPPETPARRDTDLSAHPGLLKSPMVGTVYMRANPDSDVFAKVGDTVKEGDTIVLIEAMKTFNPITAHKSGKITNILVEDAQPVEFGEPLFIIV
jgi:acetyl-CoA carboxylase biotin carboxyl carrier protein